MHTKDDLWNTFEFSHTVLIKCFVFFIFKELKHFFGLISIDVKFQVSILCHNNIGLEMFWLSTTFLRKGTENVDLKYVFLQKWDFIFLSYYLVELSKKIKWKIIITNNPPPKEKKRERNLLHFLLFLLYPKLFFLLLFSFLETRAQSSENWSRGLVIVIYHKLTIQI